ncbi:group II intron reverse transcriptase/maturase [Clostridioides difficile]|nr:group II intron reverse transcriptase/maturase [Clostridioides difficile]
MTTFMKKKLLRNNEYYDTQKVADKLYWKSLNNYNHYKLIELITHSNNIKLAYRNIKRNKGSKTPGTNGTTIEEIANMGEDNLIKYIQNRFENYKPMKVRRVMIPKDNGDYRPLGIPTMEDRIIQQCIKQVLEPICEAKFHKHSYGFRPNRSTHHAIARVNHLVNIGKLQYVVDIDIKGFFDNINHGKLLKQLWSLGIRDKRLIKILSKTLKTEIEGEGTPISGTPQGGIISPLLSNVVLNELDWWLASQYESSPIKNIYTRSFAYTALKKTNLKEFYHVRYADDFKILCRNYETAQKIFIATKEWLQQRLRLEISPTKSKIVNLKTNHSEFLGLKLKAVQKNGKGVCYSHISDKTRNRIVKDYRKRVQNIVKQPIMENACKLNAFILGVHNYYKVATHVSKDFRSIDFQTRKMIHHRLHNISKRNGVKSDSFKRLYGEYKCITYNIGEVTIFPMYAIKNRPSMSFSQNICNYTKEGREIIHNKLIGIDNNILKYIVNNPVLNMSSEYNDNRISLYVGQKGICKITKLPLKIGEMEIHHIIPKGNGGLDEYKNLAWLNKDIHKLIHVTDLELIKKISNKYKLDINNLKVINKYRRKVGNCVIE